MPDPDETDPREATMIDPEGAPEAVKSSATGVAATSEDEDEQDIADG